MSRKQLILYGIFGILTTVINIGAFLILSQFCYYLLANVLAWVLAVLFAFFTNKYFVFSSKSFHPSVCLREMWEFFLARLSTGVVDFTGMYLSISILRMDACMAKVSVNVLVIVLNYLLSKYWIFRK